MSLGTKYAIIKARKVPELQSSLKRKMHFKEARNVIKWYCEDCGYLGKGRFICFHLWNIRWIFHCLLVAFGEHPYAEPREDDKVYKESHI